MEARKTQAFTDSLSDNLCGAFKVALVIDSQRAGQTADFEDLAEMAEKYKNSKIRGKLGIYDDGGSGSHGRALHTVAHRGARAFRKRGGCGEGSRRGRGGDKQLDERPFEREKLYVEPKTWDTGRKGRNKCGRNDTTRNRIY